MFVIITLQKNETVCFALDSDNVTVAESILEHCGRKTSNFLSELPLLIRL